MNQNPKSGRPTGWESRLAAFIDERRNRAFAWGTHDCCLFAADWLLLCHGHDHAANWRGRYRSALGAARLVRARFTSPRDMFAAEQFADEAGFREIPPAFARRGDLVSVLGPRPSGREVVTLGVCLGVIAATPGLRCLVASDRHEWRRAWRV